MKAHMKRLKSNPAHGKQLFDTEYVNGSFKRFPQVNEGFLFLFDKINKGWWTTTPLKDVRWYHDRITFKTYNSTYVIRRGWK